MLNALFILCTLNSTLVEDYYADIREITRTELNTAPAFVRFSESGDDTTNSSEYVAVARRQNVHSLRLVTYKVRTQLAVDRLWRDLMPSVAPSLQPTGFSGLPIGAKMRRVENDRLISLNVVDGLFIAQAMLVYGPLSSQVADKDLVEGLTRRMLARCRGLQATVAPPMTIGQVSVTSIVGSSGVRMVDLHLYMQALGLQLMTNHIRGTASFTSGGELVIVPLAARKIKDGSRWIETNDISVMKDGKWYVSYAALQDARGQ